MTHTFATLEISSRAYDEIEQLLIAAGYGSAVVDAGLDMFGLCLSRRDDALVRAIKIAKQIGGDPLAPDSRY